MLTDIGVPFLSVESVHMCLLGEARIPEVEISPLGLSITDTFEEGISLAHHGFIVSLHTAELLIGSLEDRVDIVSPDRWGEVEEIHIEW